MAWMKAFVLAIAALLATVAHAQTPVERHGQLHIEGTRVVDAQGKPVTLRGMSLFWSQWIPRYYNEATLRRLRDEWGITVIRAAMAVEHGGYLTNPRPRPRRSRR